MRRASPSRVSGGEQQRLIFWAGPAPHHGATHLGTIHGNVPGWLMLAAPHRPQGLPAGRRRARLFAQGGRRNVTTCATLVVVIISPAVASAKLPSYVSRTPSYATRTVNGIAPGVHC